MVSRRRADFPLRCGGVVVGSRGRDALDGDLEVGQVLSGAADHRDAERLDRGGELVADLVEGTVGVRGHQDPLALRQQV